MGAVERDEFLRAAWKVMVAEQVEAKRLVFVDEMGTSSSLFRNLEFRLLCTLGHREERGPTGLCLATGDPTRRCFRA
jgi:hypothetical protein